MFVQHKTGQHTGGMKPPWRLLLIFVTLGCIIYSIGTKPSMPGIARWQEHVRVSGRNAGITTVLEARQRQQRFCEQLDLENMPQKLTVPWSPYGSDKGSTEFELMQGLRSSAYGLSALYRQYLYAEGDIVSKVMQERGWWEPGEMRNIVEALMHFAESSGLQRSGVYLLDIGANIGACTLATAAYGFSVVAVEPMHANVVALRHSMCINRNFEESVTLLTNGLGNQTQHCSIASGSTNMGDGAMFCNQDVPRAYEKRQDLDIFRLDGVLEGELRRLAGRVGVVKVDVEGFELSVLQGGLEFFKAVRPPNVVMECNDGMMMRASGQPASRLFQEMSKLGYIVREDGFTGRQVMEERLESWQQPGIENFYFTLPEAPH